MLNVKMEQPLYEKMRNLVEEKYPTNSAAEVAVYDTLLLFIFEAVYEQQVETMQEVLRCS